MLKSLVTLSFLVLPFASIAQKQEDPIPTGSKFIVVTVPDSLISVAYKKLAAHLIRNGYTLSNSDKELGFINTERKEIQNAWQLRISASIVDNKIRFSGKQFIAGFTTREYEIEYFGVKKAMFKTCFREVDRIARDFPNVAINYER